MYPFQLDRITRPALLHLELFSGRCEFLLEEPHPSDVATGPITARDEDELGDVSQLRCMSLELAVRPEGANHQWRRNPPGELSIDPVADERLMRVTAWVGAS